MPPSNNNHQMESSSSTEPPQMSASEFQRASKYAVRVCEEMTAYSRLADNTDGIPLLERDEVVLGDLLGSGGFNHVFEVFSIELHDEDRGSPHAHLTQTQHQKIARKMLAKRDIPLAVKFLNDQCMRNSEDYCNGAADLLLEARYLSALASYPHPNIIHLHGVAAAGAQGFSNGIEGGYFLILDRLYDTLDNRLGVWKELERRKMVSIKTNTEYALQLKALFLRRLQVGLDLASALQHLHKLRIIFRDLKPDNVGFDYSGTLKLFDFGLAKELDPRQKFKGKYEMSGATGSRRYMAPEVALSHPYHLSADVYSFGILLWEVLSLDKAFGEMSSEQHRALVIQGERRPRLSSQWSRVIHALLDACWNPEAHLRPTMKQIFKSLTHEQQAFSKAASIKMSKGRRNSV
eukprot:CAMPEP_0116832480 /NCGR_PEP_ID=MMETSP0418-20121206/5915_1 /TAXON_ID=1158023 /ORGANISM="Astrosyne radiata, Strain 13vi08-1A" /LENGTH=404 /DNA_ID=CAMNT_0004461845 /DNA_START=15 /DNA_END=1229 /DNA_ORIENTATION=+